MAPEEQDRRSARTFPFTPPFNASGQPSMSLPVTTDADGLPIGMQVTARYGDDLTLLQLATQLEREAGWLRAGPTFPGRACEVSEASAEGRYRLSVRALLLDPFEETSCSATRFRLKRPRWLTPGGGVDDGETLHEA